MINLYQFTDLVFENHSNSFKKQFVKLPQRRQDALETTLGKILTGTLSGGNDLETRIIHESWWVCYIIG